MAYKDEELTEEELKEVTAGIKDGNTKEMLDKLSKSELVQFKEVINKERELSLSDLDNVKAGIPKEMVEELKNENKDIFRKM